jgi:hypothetical protein
MDTPGEATPAGTATIFSVDDVDLDAPNESKDEPKDELEIEIEGKDQVSKESTELKEAQARIQELQGELLKLSLNKKKEPIIEPKKDKGEAEQLTDAQLIAILKEHKDDPAVLFNVAKHIAEQTAKTTRDAALADMTKQNRFAQLHGMGERVLSEDEDGYLAANPKVKAGLEEYTKNLDLDSHPLGALAAYAIYRLVNRSGEVAKETKTEPKADPNKGKMDKTRTATQGTKSSLTPDQLAMAKRFGVKPETYAKFVGGKP